MKRLGIQTIIMGIATACIFVLAILCACLGLWAIFVRCLTSGVLCALLTAIVSTLPGQRKEEGKQ